jgi:ribonuclease P protein component
MVGRLVHTADFKRMLAVPPRSRSAHFAVHHVLGCPSAPRSGRFGHPAQELSTIDAPDLAKPVDNIVQGQWLGAVIPKRHARRAVTRNLLKRQIRAVMTAHCASLAPGLWLVRLRSPFAKQYFVSAQSEVLREAARAELHGLFARAAKG